MEIAVDLDSTQGWRAVEGSSPTDLVAFAEVLDSTGRLSLILLPWPLVVQPFDGVEERPWLVTAAGRGVQRVKDGLGLVAGQGDRVGGVLDQPKLDRVGDGPSFYRSFGARFVRRFHPQVLCHERRRSLAEWVWLNRDLQHDVHSAEPISAMLWVP
jgi:hypothetical protein